MRANCRSAALIQLYTAAQCRELDRLAIEDYGMPGFTLMMRAGQAAFRQLIQRWPEALRLAVFCGKGNNAGDGYIVAGLARETGMTVELVQLGDPADLRGDAARARDWALERDVVIGQGPLQHRADGRVAADVIVDALLGTGLTGSVREPYAATIGAINATSTPVLALDIPSGVDADTGGVLGTAVMAELTVTFIGRKIGLYTGAGLDCRGERAYADLGVPSAVFRRLDGCRLLSFPGLVAPYRLPERNANVYKQVLGHIAVVGGDVNMGGAPIMAAEAALRVGAGMVTMITRGAHRPGVLARRPEIMVADADDAEQRQAAFQRASCLVVGPGLGTASWGEKLLREALAQGKPAVLDADGLNLFAIRNLNATGPLIVTPHTGEAARLLALDSDRVQTDRLAAALQLATRAGGVAVLKGAGSIIATQAQVQAGGNQSSTDVSAASPVLLGICGHGNPGMASAGMGDVLSGVIAGCLAQGLEPAAAAVMGTCLHSYAADLAAAETGQRSLLATDLLPQLIAALREQELAAK